MFTASTAIASLSGNRSKRDEESTRDAWRERLYSEMNELQRKIDACQLSPSEGVAQWNALIVQYYQACDAFKNKSVSQSCRNNETEDYPGGATYGGFVTRRARLAAAGANCNQTVPAPAPVETLPAPVQIAPGPSSGAGCCGYNPGDSVVNVNGNVGFNWGGGGPYNGGGGWGGVDGAGSGGGFNAPARAQGILATIGAAVDAAVHGGDSGFVGADTSGYNSGYNSGAQVVDFPMTDAYDPILDTGSPVPGMNVFPDDPIDMSMPGARNSTFNKGETNVRPGAESMSGFGDDTPAIEVGDLGTVTTYASPSPIYAQGVQLPSGGPSTLSQILGTLTQILPATISAIKGKPYYNTAQQGNTGQFQTGLPQTQQTLLPGQAGANIGAQAGAAVGNIGDTISNIVAQNPLLVLGGVVGVILLFTKSPSRR